MKDNVREKRTGMNMKRGCDGRESSGEGGREGKGKGWCGGGGRADMDVRVIKRPRMGI